MTNETHACVYGANAANLMMNPVYVFLTSVF